MSGISWEVKIILDNETFTERGRLPEIVAEALQEHLRKEDGEFATRRRAGKLRFSIKGALGTWRIPKGIPLER